MVPQSLICLAAVGLLGACAGDGWPASACRARGLGPDSAAFLACTEALLAEHDALRARDRARGP